jgi:hypothetical protein
MVKPIFIDPNPLYTNLEALLYKLVKRSISGRRIIDSVDHKWPIYAFIAIEQMTLQDESEDVFAVSSITNINCGWQYSLPIMVRY